MVVLCANYTCFYNKPVFTTSQHVTESTCFVIHHHHCCCIADKMVSAFFMLMLKEFFVIDRKGDTIYKQMRKLGSSVDWSRDVFTMDEVGWLPG